MKQSLTHTFSLRRSIQVLGKELDICVREEWFEEAVQVRQKAVSEFAWWVLRDF